MPSLAPAPGILRGFHRNYFYTNQTLEINWKLVSGEARKIDYNL